MRAIATAFRHIACVAALAGAMTYATEAQAALITVDSVGDSFTVNFDGNSGGNTIAGLTASALFTVESFGTNSIGFKIDLTNTSSNGVTSRVSSLGFDTTPTITGATSTGIFNFAVLGDQYPNGFGNIEACFNDQQANTCNSGGNGGVTNGNTGTFHVLLSFNGPITEFAFDKFGVRYQSLNVGTGSGTGTGTVPGDPTPTVPEPTSMILLGTGLVGAFAARRRARQ